MKAYTLLILLILTSDLAAAADSIGQAVQLYEHGHFHRAVALLSDTSQSSPKDAEVRFWLGRSLLKIQKWDDAVREMEKAVELEPNNAIHYLWLGRACGGRASHSFFLTALGWAKKVAKAFQTAEKLAPDNIDVKFDLLEFYLNAPATVGGGRDKAEAEAKTIAQLSPANGHSARAIIFEKDKKWDQAQDELVQATTQFPGDADAFMDLADYLLRRQDFEGAATNAQKAVSLDPNLSRAKLILAAAQIRLGKNVPEAEDSVKAISRGPFLKDQDPSFEEVFYWLGQAYLAEGRKYQAREAFSTALRYNPDYDKAKSGLSQTR
jgi:tetratricopeptide (TPR) repeat protein